MNLIERLNPLLHLRRLGVGLLTVALVGSFFYVVYLTSGVILIVAWGVWWFGGWIQGLED